MIKSIKLFCAAIFFSSLFLAVSAQKDFTSFVDPRIGNVSTFLVPTYPTFQLPNQQLRMFPIKTDYIADQLTAWPLQVMSHRTPGILHIRVSTGDVSNKPWNAKMTI